MHDWRVGRGIRTMRDTRVETEDGNQRRPHFNDFVDLEGQGGKIFGEPDPRTGGLTTSTVKLDDTKWIMDTPPGSL
jgi:hypothetical protein